MRPPPNHPSPFSSEHDSPAGEYAADEERCDTRKYEEMGSTGADGLIHMALHGRLQGRETIVDGLENATGAFLGLLRGDNLGKMVVRL